MSSRQCSPAPGMRQVAMLALAALAAGPAGVTNSPPELRAVLSDLMAWLPGECDNAAQGFFEREQKTPDAEVHARIYRA